MANDKQPEKVKSDSPKLVNIFDRRILGEVTREVPWIEGAEVTFLNDIPGDFTDKFEQKTKELGEEDAGRWSVMQTVIKWNFSDEKGNKLECNVENFKKLPIKVQKWIFNEGSKAMLTDEERKKGLPVTS